MPQTTVNRISECLKKQKDCYVQLLAIARLQQKAIDAQMATGKYATEDDVLRDALRALQHEDVETVAIQAAVDEWQQGDEGLPLEEAFDEIRRSIRDSGSL